MTLCHSHKCINNYNYHFETGGRALSLKCVFVTLSVLLDIHFSILCVFFLCMYITWQNKHWIVLHFLAWIIFIFGVIICTVFFFSSLFSSLIYSSACVFRLSVYIRVPFIYLCPFFLLFLHFYLIVASCVCECSIFSQFNLVVIWGAMWFSVFFCSYRLVCNLLWNGPFYFQCSHNFYGTIRSGFTFDTIELCFKCVLALFSHSTLFFLRSLSFLLNLFLYQPCNLWEEERVRNHFSIFFLASFYFLCLFFSVCPTNRHTHTFATALDVKRHRFLCVQKSLFVAHFVGFSHFLFLLAYIKPTWSCLLRINQNFCRGFLLIWPFPCCVFIKLLLLCTKWNAILRSGCCICSFSHFHSFLSRDPLFLSLSACFPPPNFPFRMLHAVHDVRCAI